MPVRVVIFDLDNTLVPEMANYERAFDEAIEPLIASHGVDVRTLRRAVFEASRDLWLRSSHADLFLRLGIGSPTSLVTDLPGARFDAVRGWLSEYRSEAWRRGLRACGMPDETVGPKLDAAFRERQRTFSPPYQDALAAVRDAAGHYGLVLATNGPGDVQRRKLNAAGLAPFFPLVIASGDVGYGKPDPRIFANALAVAGAHSAEAVSVGDSVEKDVDGARAAGVRSVLVARDPSDGSAARADRVIASLDELAKTLGSMS